jgi:O-antigen/teichoic acid export membrane protein
MSHPAPKAPPAGSSQSGSTAVPSLTIQAFWLILAKTIGFVFSVALPILLVRIFSPTEFGMYKQAFVVVGTSMAILPFSVGISAFYFLARRPEKNREVVFHIVLYHTVIGAAAGGALALRPALLELILGAGTPLTAYSAVIGATIFTWLVSSFLEVIATAAADVVYSTVFIIAAQASRALLLTGAAVFGRTVDAVLYAAVIHGVLQCCVLFWYLQRRFPGFWKCFDREIALEQFWYVIPLGVTGVIYSIQVDLHNYLVANKFSAAEYAIYAVGTSPVPLVGILRDSVNSVMLPRVSKLQQEGNREDILRVMLRSWRKLAAAIFPVFAALLALGYEFITVVYTARYQASWPIFALNLTLLVLGILITDAVVRGHMEIRSWMVTSRVVAIIVQVGVSLLAMPLFGMIGALMGIVVAAVVDRTIMLRVLFRLLGFSRSHLRALTGMAWFAVASAIAAVAAVGTKWILHEAQPGVRLVCGSAVFGVVYVAGVLFLGVLDTEEKELVNRYLRKLPGVPLLP